MMLLSTMALNNRKKSSAFAITVDSPATFSSRQSLLSPTSPHRLTVDQTSATNKSRKSSFNTITVKEIPQANVFNPLSVIAVGKMKQKAAQTKQFFKDQANNRRNLLNLSIHDSEIAKVYNIYFDNICNYEYI